MSSIIERLTEGVVNRDMRSEGNALLSKWERTGLLEGLVSDRQRGTMARLLENQAKELLRESSSMSAGDVEGFAAVAFPIVRRVFAGLIANDLVSVQPMSLPSGLIFFLDFVYSPNIGGSNAQTQRFANVADKSIYGTDRVGSQITGGVNIVGNTAYKENLSGPRDIMGYAYASPSASAAVAHDEWTVTDAFSLSGSTDEQKRKYLQYDPDLLALSSSTNTLEFGVIRVAKVDLTGSVAAQDADFNNLGAFSASFVAMDGVGASDVVIRRLTALTASTSGGDKDYVQFVIASVGAGVGTLVQTFGVGSGTAAMNFPIKDNLTTSNALGSVVGTTIWGLEGNEDIPEIDIKVDSIAVTAQTKKLKAKWTPELGQDLNAYHNLDAEVELTSILSEQIALEIDREILADLVNGATASTFYWSRSPGLFVNRTTGAEVGASSAAPDFTGTVSEWYETLVETINDVSAAIHRKTLRGGANFVVCGPEVANILEFTSGFRASITHDDDSGSIGAVQTGSLSKKFDVIVDPYFLRNVVLIGRRGSSFLESGYVYAPYVPLQTTPTIFGPEDFVPRKGVMTRYAKQMVRPDMYGLVIIRGLLGEAGATS
tara:strand:- start:53 stop:1855 length:1803 start_codon:yes stop_codon:yes gene_type:complete